MNTNIGKYLEQYTITRPQEVLLVTAQIEGQTDRIAIFKGFSSSLMRSTAFDPEIPVLPDEAEILSIDRVASPYHPDNPQYIEKGLTWETMQPLLDRAGIRV
ncbi:hypothetical protein IQ235_12895 [Oscillatoriales cyanobacterium LEGE 11467]|uniref:DUF7734 domain-containing protein n=1 Tax=Zarconia navalis LEGE 11467 TaxID=1828826 RepID=A0A928Z9H2_9CYAN|nr:hypothetical protein [Zarconia navalis]MBE9041678.1 hypothetical protein [Zarconia navalis LEGE 11467]